MNNSYAKPSDKDVTLSAKNLDLALIKAAGALGVSSENISYRVNEEKKGSFLNLFAKPKVEITAWIKKDSAKRGRSNGKPGRKNTKRGQGNGQRPSYKKSRSGNRSDGEVNGNTRDSQYHNDEIPPIRMTGHELGQSLSEHHDDQVHGNVRYQEDSRSGGGRGRSGGRSNGRSGGRSRGGNGQRRGRGNSSRNGGYRSNNRRMDPPRKLEKVTEEQLETIKTEITSFGQEMISLLLGESVTLSLNWESSLDRLIVNVDNPAFMQMVEENNKLADSIEHLLRKKIREVAKDTALRIFVDAGNARKERENELSQLAADLSDKVHENQRPIVLNYRNPYDRKIIHMALDSDDRVYTKSIGSGHNRKLMILPVKPEGEGDMANGASAEEGNSHENIQDFDTYDEKDAAQAQAYEGAASSSSDSEESESGNPQNPKNAELT